MNAQRWQRFSPFSRVAHSHTHTLSHFIYDAVSWAVLLHSQNTTHNAHTALLACLQTFSIENTTSVAFELNGCLNWFRRHQRFGTQFNSDLSIHHIIRACLHVCAIFFFTLFISENSKRKTFSSLAYTSECEWVMLLCVRKQHLFNWFIHPFHNAMWKLFLPVFRLKLFFALSLWFLFGSCFIYVFLCALIELIIIWKSSLLWMTCAQNRNGK